MQRLIEWNLNVYGLVLKLDEVPLDIDMPETYWKALELTDFHAVR